MNEVVVGLSIPASIQSSWRLLLSWACSCCNRLVCWWLQGGSCCMNCRGFWGSPSLLSVEQLNIFKTVLLEVGGRREMLLKTIWGIYQKLFKQRNWASLSWPRSQTWLLSLQKLPWRHFKRKRRFEWGGCERMTVLYQDANGILSSLYVMLWECKVLWLFCTPYLE